MARSDVVDIEGIIVRETPFAILFRADEDAEAVWLPRSQIEVDDTGNTVTITIPEWLAEKEGLI